MEDIEEIKRIPKESHISLDIRVPAEPVKYDIDLSGNMVDSESVLFLRYPTHNTLSLEWYIYTPH